MRRESGAIDSPVQVPSTDKDRSKANKSRVIYSTSDAAQFHCPACHQLSSQTSDDSDSEVSGHHRDCPQLRAEKRIAKLKRPEGHVAIVVGGRRFTIARTMLQQHPDTMLGRMFGSSFDTSLTQSSETGDFPITKEISPATFKAILDFYKHGTIRCPPNVTASELREACSYFLIPFTHQSVKCEDLGKFLHELSSNGAQSQFERFLDETIVPAMARSAQIGDRECHIVVLCDGETVEWDDELPPQLGEQYAQIVHNTALSRFLKYHENRDIAKSILKERGLKKIRIGIEGVK